MERDLSTSSEVNNVRPDVSTVGQMIGAASELGLQVIEKSQKAKIVENLSNSQIELTRLNEEVRKKYESNPEEAKTIYQEKRRSIFDRNAKNISAVYRSQFIDSAKNIELNDNLTFESWVVRQSQKNTVSSVNTAVKNSLDLAFKEGLEFGESGEGDISLLLNYGNSRSAIENFAATELGAQTANDLLDNFDKDYVKQMVDGLSRSNPLKAAELLEREEIKEAVGDERDYQALKSTVESEIFKMAERADYQRLVTEARTNRDLMMQRAQGELNYLDVEKLERDAQITPQFASVLKKGLMKPQQVSSSGAALSTDGSPAPSEMTDVDKARRFNELMSKYTELVSDTGKPRNKTLTEYAQFQQDVLDAEQQGVLTKTELRQFLTVDSIIDKKIDEGNNFFTDYKYTQDPLYTSFKSIDGFLAANKTLDTAEIKSGMFRKALEMADVEELERFDKSSDRKNYLRGVAQDVVKDALVELYPELAVSEELPREVRLSNGTVIKIPYNIATAKTGVQVRTPAPVIKERYATERGDPISLQTLSRLAKEQGYSDVNTYIKVLVDAGKIK